MSTTGDSAVTEIVSASAPTLIVALTDAVNPVVRMMLSRCWRVNPSSANVTV